jgi:uncharacterized protein (UPF0335 family)
METIDLIQQIEQKSKRLLSRMERLEQENSDLKKSVFAYLEKMDAQVKEINQLKQKIQVLDVKNSVSMDKKTLQRQLDKYIHLIDKCIANVNHELLGK